jgi:hypothetical protein
MAALAARVVASLEADELSEELVFGYSAPFPEGADPNAWLEGIATAVENNLDEQRPFLEEAEVSLPITMGLDRTCRAPNVTTAHLVVDHLDRVARLAQRYARRVIVVLHPEGASPERAIALGRAFASSIGGDRVKCILLVESALALANLAESTAPLPPANRLRVDALDPLLCDESAALDTLVQDPTRRVLVFVSQGPQSDAVLNTPQFSGRDPKVRSAVFDVPCGQPVAFAHALVRALAALRATHLGESTDDPSALPADLADPNLGPEGVAADFAERVARVVCRDDQVLLIAVRPAPLATPPAYGVSMLALAAAAASPRVRWVLFDPSHGAALPVLHERERRVEHARVEVTPPVVEQGLRQRLAAPSLPPLERMQLCLALAGFALGRGAWDEALSLQDQALGIARSTQDPGEEATALFSIGQTFYAQKQWEQANRLFARASELAMDARRDPLALQCLTSLGHGKLCAGQLDEAERCYQSASEWYERLGAPIQSAWVRTWLGETLRRRGRPREAEDTWRDVVARYDALGPDLAAAARPGRAEVIERLARLHEQLGQHAEAARWRGQQHPGVDVPPVMEQP